MSAGGGLAVLSAGLKEVAKNRRFPSLPEPISLGALASADWDRLVHAASTDGIATGIASVKRRRGAPRSRRAASLLSGAVSPRKQSTGAPAQQNPPQDDDDDDEDYDDAVETQDDEPAPEGTPIGKASSGLLGGFANNVVGGMRALATLTGGG